MNCKPGDLAVIVKSSAGNEGAIVKIVEFVGKVQGWGGYDRWRIDRKLKGDRGNLTDTARDWNLRPIRDNDGEDETLQWAPVPVKEIA